MNEWMDGFFIIISMNFHIRVFTCPTNFMNTEIVEMNDLTTSANTVLNIVNVKVVGHINRQEGGFGMVKTNKTNMFL